MDDGFGHGRIEVIAGPMFAGKSEELVRRVRRAEIARRRVATISHELDTRKGTGRVASHSGLELPSRTAATASSIPGLLDARTELVAVDEAQFFGDGLAPVAAHVGGAESYQARCRRHR